ncbi:MAG: F0F1 ATP synthase subunit epsilon [Pirellulaceae bacterium]
MAALTCIVVTPEETALEEKADFVALPLYDGEIGIAPARAPMIGRLGYGELRIRSGDSVARYYVDGGFVQVADNVVSILTNRTIPADQIDAEATSEQIKETLTKPAHTLDLREIRDRAILQGRAQIRIAKRSQEA